MGFNTAAFLLNDFMHELEKSPRTVTWMLTHPPHSKRELEEPRYRDTIRSVAKDYGEPVPHHQALEVLPTFHADHTHWLRAGGNCCEPMEFEGYRRRRNGTWTATLKLPKWAVDRLEENYQARKRPKKRKTA